MKNKNYYKSLIGAKAIDKVMNRKGFINYIAFNSNDWQICWFSFVRIINKEKKEKYTQYKYAEQQNDKDFHHWFNKVYAGVDIGRRDFFGLTDLDMDRFDIMCTPKKTKGKRTRKSKKPTLDL